MPFSLFAVKSLELAQQPLKNRITTVKKIYYAKCTGTAAMYSTINMPILINKVFIFIPFL